MKCNRCKADIGDGGHHEYYGWVLCKNCRMDALSPVQTCEPWAVYTAKSFRSGACVTELSEMQTRILGILRETGGAEPPVLVSRLQIRPADLEREVATLRHMGKLRPEMRDGKKLLVLW